MVQKELYIVWIPNPTEQGLKLGSSWPNPFKPSESESLIQQSKDWNPLNRNRQNRVSHVWIPNPTEQGLKHIITGRNDKIDFKGLNP